MILFPSVRSLSLAPIVEVQTDTTSSTRYVAVLLGLEAGKTLPPAEFVKLQHWFRARVPGDSLAFITKTAHSNKQ